MISPRDGGFFVAVLDSFVADTEFDVHWVKFQATGVYGLVHSSEKEFWRRVAAQYMPINQVFFGSFLHDGPGNFTLRFKGQSDGLGQ